MSDSIAIAIVILCNLPYMLKIILSGNCVHAKFNMHACMHRHALVIARGKAAQIHKRCMILSFRKSYSVDVSVAYTAS